jgi:hypothetical protein
MFDIQQPWLSAERGKLLKPRSASRTATGIFCTFCLVSGSNPRLGHVRAPDALSLQRTLVPILQQRRGVQGPLIDTISNASFLVRRALRAGAHQAFLVPFISGRKVATRCLSLLVALLHLGT